MDKIIVLISGVGLIGLIYWFFFGVKKDPPSHKAECITPWAEGQEKEAAHVHH